MNSSWKKYKLGDLLQKDQNSFTINDQTTYKRITVKVNNKGIILRDELEGFFIGTKRQFKTKNNQFVISKIDARNGAMGLIPKELGNAIVTTDFPLFSFSEKLDCNFFDYYSKTPPFLNCAPTQVKVAQTVED